MNERSELEALRDLLRTELQRCEDTVNTYLQVRGENAISNRLVGKIRGLDFAIKEITHRLTRCPTCGTIPIT